MYKTFEQKLNEIKKLVSSYIPHQLIVNMVEISNEFEGNERYMLLESLRQVIEFHGAKKALNDLSDRIEPPFETD